MPQLPVSTLLRLHGERFAPLLTAGRPNLSVTYAASVGSATAAHVMSLLIKEAGLTCVPHMDGPHLMVLFGTAEAGGMRTRGVLAYVMRDLLLAFPAPESPVQPWVAAVLDEAPTYPRICKAQPPFAALNDEISLLSVRVLAGLDAEPRWDTLRTLALAPAGPLAIPPTVSLNA